MSSFVAQMCIWRRSAFLKFALWLLFSCSWEQRTPRRCGNTVVRKIVSLTSAISHTLHRLKLSLCGTKKVSLLQGLRSAHSLTRFRGTFTIYWLPSLKSEALRHRSGAQMLFVSPVRMWTRRRQKTAGSFEALMPPFFDLRRARC